MNWLEELLTGTPQAARTLQALLGQTRVAQNLNASHYGPNDSMIGSMLAHPVEGINKAQDWVNNRVTAASNAPIMPMTDPRAAESASGAALDLAGLLQMGAMPTAPSGYGVLGTVRRPQDMMVKVPPSQLSDGYRKNNATNADKIWANYINKNWLTDNDSIVKYIDEGGLIAVPKSIVGDEVKTTPILSKVYSNFKKLMPKYGYEFTPTKEIPSISSLEKLSHVDIINKLQNGEPLTKKEQSGINEVSKFAEFIRNKVSGHQSANTPIGKIYEDYNDIVGIGTLGSVKRKKLSSNYINDPFWQKHPETVDIFRRNIDKQNEALDPILNSDYYKKNKNNINVFNPFASNNIETPSHISDINPDVDPTRMSLSGLLSQTVKRDTVSAKAALKANKEMLLSEAMQKKETVQELPGNISWNKLTAPEALKAEGKYQGHCVGNYCEKVSSGKSEIYSLRGPDNKPLLTAEWDPLVKKFTQVKGRFNSSVPKELKPSVKSLEDLLTNKKK